MKTTTIFLVVLLMSVSSAQTLHIDSVSVDSVWNSDSSWNDSKGILQKRQSRDCKLSFIPAGTGTVQIFVSLSTDSGKTWANQTDGFNQIFPCGSKSSLAVRILGEDKQSATFRITGRQYKPVITGSPQLIRYPSGLSGGPVPGASAAVPVKLQLADSSSKGYTTVVKAYWDAMGDGIWDDSTASLSWIWNTTVPFGEAGQRRTIIAKVRDANGLWSVPETLTVQFGVSDEVSIFSEDFENDLSKWEQNFMINVGDFYSRMRITSQAAYSGIYSLTTDSNRTALLYKISPRFDSGICGVQFYLMAKAKGQINFTVELGQDAGSSGGLFKAFGIGFDVRDSVKTTNYDAYTGRIDKMVGPIVPDHWYKCKIEIDFTTKKTAYYIDDQKIDEGNLPILEMYGIDRLLVFRGEGYITSDENVIPCIEGPKPYFIDNVVFYKKSDSLDNETPGRAIISEGFEGDLAKYKQILYSPEQGIMSISKQYVHSGNGSLTSDSNSTSIKCLVNPEIMDSIAGLQFYIMATKRSQTNTICAICKMGSSKNGLYTIMGMGISKSDSLGYVYENAPEDPLNEHRNFAALELNRWYKCKIEYNYSDTTLTYYLNDAIVHKKNAPDPMMLNLFVVMRDGLGTQGPSGYYVDDVTVYKR
jgi:hypothetical protein